jgi:chorismate synthase
LNTFGRIFRTSIHGESHGKGLGILIDGCPFGIPLSESDFEADILRRKSGSSGTTPRLESDKVEIISGVFDSKTTGSPILLSFKNENTKSRDYKKLENIPRPSHADFVAKEKFSGFNDSRGGGQFSGRMTLALVGAGVIAKKILNHVSFESKVLEVGGEKEIDKAIKKALAEKDTIGGIVECRISNLEIGLGEPFFDSIESYLSHLAFSIPGVKAIEFGAGFAFAKMSGSKSNDLFITSGGKTKTNNSGGINGGISNGNQIIFRVAVKAPSSIGKSQKTMNMKSGEIVDLEIGGRHDICIALRFPVILESISAIALADLHLINKINKKND